MNIGEAWLLLLLGTILGVVWTLIAIEVYKWWKERKRSLEGLYTLIQSLTRNNEIYMKEIDRLNEKVKQKDDECNAYLIEIVKERTKNK